jgi:CheY-like chemotaxis protein
MLDKAQETGRILIFKDAAKAKSPLAAELERSAAGQRCSVLMATDPARLRQLLQGGNIDAVVIDVGREIGHALAVLRVLKGQPAIPVFVCNSFMLPRIQEKAREYGQVHYWENDSGMDEFIHAVLDAVARKKRDHVQSISLDGFLRLMKKEKWSGQVRVLTGEESGMLSLRDGRLASASAMGLTGQAACRKMASWENIAVETSIQPLPARLQNARAAAAADDRPAGVHADQGSIEMLYITRPDRKIALNLKRLNQAVEEMRALLPWQLLRTDIFLTENGRSLAGWNSHPLACSSFAAITKSLKDSLRLSRFPELGRYYLLDLAEDQLVFMAVTDELQWGFLLAGAKERLGLLLNIILPRALKSLGESLAVEKTA